jgi:hypothetical protein
VSAALKRAMALSRSCAVVSCDPNTTSPVNDVELTGTPEQKFSARKEEAEPSEIDDLRGAGR